MLEREWVSVRDPADDHRRYTFDVSFLLSNYTCIYGAGCQGITADDDPILGCCIHGAYLNEDDDAEELLRIVEEDLDPATMQFHRQAMRKGLLVEDEEGEQHTRVHKSACILLNRAGFPGGEGCALHHLAERQGVHHMTHKPVVCWQVPLHRTVSEETADDGATLEVHTIAAYQRGHWGEGGADFGWWCLDDDQAFVGRRPVYRSMETELRTMVGDDVYDTLAGFLDQRRGQRGRVRFLPML
ncbi:hypothetical protein [Egicoccus sp. AB-alg2]|uniref:hypothetical protein n=1 Tax=Egicoccus sp. AB-alg2 TaxID=3242693 RepID=UPI00359DD1BF